MIKATELRPGNFVQVIGIYKDSINTAGFISIDAEFIYLVENGKIGALAIPLTPEILEKCGFVDLAKNGGAYRMNISSVDELCFYVIDGFIRYQTIGSGFTRYFNESVKHLHHLQNLYFVLTGEEIQYTP